MLFLHRIKHVMVIAALAMAAASPLAASAASEGSREVLWHTVTSCLDPTAFDYCGNCPVPRTDRDCPQATDCGNTLQLWTESTHYVSFRDRKMCECPSAFVHGLAVPRAKVTGVEDPCRPSGIWNFAWGAARTRIADEKEIALYVNPMRTRSQDQLHVHLVRLRPDARQRFARLTVSRILSLDEVWTAARLRAAALQLADYGVLVATHPDGGYLVLVTPQSPNEFTQSSCSRKD